MALCSPARWILFRISQMTCERLSGGSARCGQVLERPILAQMIIVSMTKLYWRQCHRLQKATILSRSR
jgi:hypothetical protein